MAQRSAGILLYRKAGSGIELFLVHPGGPFWARKDDGAWSIPKGLYAEGDDALAAAKREFQEETGAPAEGEFVKLGHFKQPSGKVIVAWGLEGEFDISSLSSNMFSMQWPPKSGKQQEFPGVDRAGWFSSAEAIRKVLKGQRPILETLLSHLNVSPEEGIKPVRYRTGRLSL
jgi:predicted NUDIX family NTP pyrophosphohydrolase